MENTICNNMGTLSTFSVSPQLAGNLLRVGGGKSFTGLELLRSLSGYVPTQTVEPETFADSNAYAKHLEAKFGMRVTAKYFKKDQESMDALGRSMSGNDLVIAPNILNEMATNRDKAQYYEEKIQYWFDNIPKWKAESAAMGLTYEPCGVAIHEDGTVYYIGGGTETPERKAQIEAAQKAQREKKFKRRREQQEYVQNLILQKQADALTANWKALSEASSALVTTKKFLPDGSVYITMKREGKIVERTTRKPHLIPVADSTTESGVTLEPIQDIFDGMI